MAFSRSLSCASAALCVALSASFAQAQTMQVSGIAAGDSLNVRKGPTSRSRDIGDLLEGDVIFVIGTNAAGTWSQIDYHGQRAWVSSRYLVGVQGGGGAPISPGPHTVVGIPANDPDGGLVIRDGPGKAYSALGTYPNGYQLNIIQLSNDGKWGMVALRDRVAWVSTAYLAAGNATPMPMPSPTPQIAPDGGPLPAVFTVTGVSSNDRLWVRAAPQATAPRLGEFPNGAVVNVTGRASGSWVQVTFNAQIGYVNSKYLVRTGANGPQTSNGFPLGITCMGTEPFWTLTIAQDRTVEYTSLIDGADTITSLTQTTPSVGGGYPFDFVAAPYSGTLNSQACSDGMSDNAYTMAIKLFNPGQNGSSPYLYACCNVD